MSVQTVIEPGHWLFEAAAASWARMLAAGMPRGGITEAGRTRARQEYLYAQYLAGKLPAYAARPGTSKHENGRAVDVKTTSGAQAWLIKHGAAHGWTRPLLWAAKPEPWHWEYDVTRDTHLTDGTTPPAPIEEDPMPALTDDEQRRLLEAADMLRQHFMHVKGRVDASYDMARDTTTRTQIIRSQGDNITNGILTLLGRTGQAASVVAALSDEDVERLAHAVADEQARRLGGGRA